MRFQGGHYLEGTDNLCIGDSDGIRQKLQAMDFASRGNDRVLVISGQRPLPARRAERALLEVHAVIDGFVGRAQEPQISHQDEQRCRLIVPAGIGYVRSRLCDSRVSLGGRLWTALELILLCFNPRLFSGLLWPGDRVLYRMLYWCAARQVVRAYFGRTRR